MGASGQDESLKMDTTRAKLPPSIWALGLVSLFMDISSEMIHALLPVFLVTVLGANMLTVGVIEGVGEALASIIKLFAGSLSDRIGKRKILVVSGYALGALSKPLFALAPNAAWVLFARLTDRTGKGVRGAPRDAMIADLAPTSLRGAAYGLRQSLDTLGAFIGPLLAIALMALRADDFRMVFNIAIIPGLIAVLILLFAVREPARKTEKSTPANIMSWRKLPALGRGCWAVVMLAAIVMLARFSAAFLVLRATGLGLPLMLAPLVFMVMNAVYALAAYPVGKLSDRVGRVTLLALGVVTLIVADLVMASAHHLWTVMIGVTLWGLHLALSEGLLASLIADTAPPSLRGTAFGIFHLVVGFGLLAASLIAGALWQRVGPSASFYTGAAIATIGLAGIFLYSRGKAL